MVWFSVEVVAVAVAVYIVVTTHWQSKLVLDMNGPVYTVDVPTRC